VTVEALCCESRLTSRHIPTGIITKQPIVIVINQIPAIVVSQRTKDDPQSGESSESTIIKNMTLDAPSVRSAATRMNDHKLKRRRLPRFGSQGFKCFMGGDFTLLLIPIASPQLYHIRSPPTGAAASAARAVPDNRFESNPPNQAASSASHEWPIFTKFSVELPHVPITFPVTESQIRTWPGPPAAMRLPLGVNATTCETAAWLSQPLMKVPPALAGCCPGSFE
jgi:hypothetical protein